MTNGNLTATRNGVTVTKPEGMSLDYWFDYEVDRIGKRYAVTKKHDNLYGMEYPQPTSGEDERGEGCDGGACSI